MPATKTRPNYTSLVLKKHPDAFLYDDGRRVEIRLRKDVTETCPTCGRDNWTHPVIVDLMPTIGQGNNSESAWKNAAERLGLVSRDLEL